MTRKFVEQVRVTEPSEESPPPGDSTVIDTEEFPIHAATVRILEYYREAERAPSVGTITVNPRDFSPEQQEQIRANVRRVLASPSTL